jgi:predicted DNA-binding transcriptional regulator YafY
VFRWGWWYVIGYCHLRQGVRSFRVDRIRELAALDEAFEPAVDFDVRVYLHNEFQGQPQLRLRLRFWPEFAQLAHDNAAIWEALEVQPDGGVEVWMAVPDAAWGASTALAYGATVEVLEPPEVRRLVRQWAAAVAEQYAGDP